MIKQMAFPGSHDIVRRELANGIVVLVRENFQAQSVVLHGAMAAGAIFEPPEKQGLVSFLTAALSRGTAHYDFARLHETLEGVGASLYCSGGMQHLNFAGKSLGEDFGLMAELLGEMLRRPSFPENQVERLRGETLTGLKMRQQNTRYMAGKLFRKLAYPLEHPYYRGSSGEVDSISALSLDDLRGFHAQQFGPQGMLVIVVGNIRAEEAISQIEAEFGDWDVPSQKVLPAIEDVPHLTEIRQESQEIAGKSQVDIVLGVPGPSRLASDYQAARLANNIFGLFGMFGRLGKEIREKQGLAYYSYSQLSGGTGPGSWRVMAGVDPRHVEQAITGIRGEVRRMVETLVDEDELADNKSNLIGSLPLQLESNEGVAAMIYHMERYGLGLDYLMRYADELNAITAADIRESMARYWSPDAFALGMAGPLGKVD